MSIGNVITIAIVLCGVVAGWTKIESGLASAQEDIQDLGLAVDAKASQADVNRVDTRVVSLEVARDDMRERMIRMELQLEQQNGQLSNQGRTLQAIADAVIPRGRQLDQ